MDQKKEGETLPCYLHEDDSRECLEPITQERNSCNTGGPVCDSLREYNADFLAKKRAAAYKGASEVLVMAHDMVNTAARMGLRVTDAQDDVTDAKSLLDVERYDGAIRVAKRAIEYAKEHMLKEAQEQSSKLTEDLNNRFNGKLDIEAYEKITLECKAIRKAIGLEEKTN